MPIDDRAKLTRAFTAAGAIRGKAQDLLGTSGTVDAVVIMSPVDQMLRADRDHIAPLVAFPEADVNAAAARQFPLNAPANTYTAMQALRSAVAAFLTAYKTVYDSAGNLTSFSVLNGHQPVPINATAALASLQTALNNIVAAVPASMVLDA